MSAVNVSLIRSYGLVVWLMRSDTMVIKAKLIAPSVERNVPSELIYSGSLAHPDNYIQRHTYLALLLHYGAEPTCTNVSVTPRLILPPTLREQNAHHSPEAP